MDTPRPQLPDFQFHQNNDSFTLHFQQRLILTHSKDNPCLWIGSGMRISICSAAISALKINYREKLRLPTPSSASRRMVGSSVTRHGSDISATLNISADSQSRHLCWNCTDNLNHNRIWLRCIKPEPSAAWRTVFLLRSAWQTVPAMDQ